MQKKTNEEWMAEVQELRIQLEEAQETLNAIRRGEVDGLVVSTPKGEQVYTMSGADKPYRVLIEDMKEGAVMLSSDNTILYCNRGFAKMINAPRKKLWAPTSKAWFARLILNHLKDLLAQGKSSQGRDTQRNYASSKTRIFWFQR